MSEPEDILGRTHEVLDRYLDKIKYLPPTPTLMVHLIELVRRPDRDAGEIVKLIRRDPALATEVLRRCNNSFFGRVAPVMDIHEAVLRLGFYEVYRITALLFGDQALTPQEGVGVPGFRLEPLRRHSSLTAIASGSIAREVGESEGFGFTAGLLHDVGKVALAAAEGQGYAALWEEYGNCGAALYEAEKATYGFHHGEIGARLLLRWGVPEFISVPALFHHHTAWSGSHKRLVAIVNLGNLIAHQIDDSEGDGLGDSADGRRALELLNLSPDYLCELEQMVRSYIKRLPALTSK